MTDDANAIAAPEVDPERLPMPEEGAGSLSSWVSAIERDEQLRRKREPKWKENLRRYKGDKPALTGYGIAGRETIGVNIDYANTEQKKALLFFQSPELQLMPKRPVDAAAQPLAQAVINDQLTNQIDILPTVDQVLMDMICPAGLGVVVIGYECFLGEPIQQPVMVPAVDPMTGQPIMGPDGQPQMQPQLDKMGQPVVEELPNIIHEGYFAERETPMKLGIPSSFTGSDYDRSPYLWREFLLDREAFKARFKVDAPEGGLVGQDDQRLTVDPDAQAAPDMVRGYEIWYRSSIYRPDVVDPERFSQLVLVKGRGGSKASDAHVLVHRDSPYQQVDKRGKLTAGMRGNPIHVLTTKYVSDDPYPPSDCSMSRAQVDELCVARSQMIMQRRRNMPMRWVDTSRDPNAKQTVERIEKGEYQSLIPVMGNGNEIVGTVASAGFPRENFTFQEILERDIAREWALGANQNGTATDAGTATEAEIMQRNTDSRLSAERAKVLRWYVKLAEKVFALMQLFSDDADFVPVVGPDGAKQLVQWNKENIQGLFKFEARPDSSIRIDAAQNRARLLQFYNLAANDPNFNRAALDRILAIAFDMDPTAVTIAKPPSPPPDKPKINVSLSGQDFDPNAPQFPVAAALLQDQGIQITEQAVTAGADAAQQIQQAHGGRATPADTIDKHAADRTGERSGPKVAEGLGAGQ